MKPVTTVVFFVLAASLTLVTTNPVCPYDVPPKRLLSGQLFTSQGCSCDKTVLDCFNLLEIPELKNDAQVVTSATFEAGEITSLPSKRLPANLISITFTQNPLTDISEGAFQTSANTLTSLTFSDALFVRLPDALRQLTNLNTFRIVNTHIADWSDATIQSLGKTVRELHLNQVGLKSWPSWLKSFTSLESLDLSENDLELLPADAFTSLESTLTGLNLALTGLTRLPTPLSTLHNLNVLDLSRNILNSSNDRPAIEQIGTMPIASKLSTLIIKSMHLTSIPDLALLTNLAVIDLSYNSITSISSGHLSVQITEIHLSYNKLTEITGSSIKNYPKLTALYVDNNPSLTMAPSAFTSLTAVKYLDISSTNLARLPQNLTALVNIQTLKMTNNPLACNCPQDPMLFHWFASCKGVITGTCTDGRNVTTYLRDSCQITRTTTTTATSLGDNDSASALGCGALCRFACFFVTFFVYINID